MLDIIFSFFHFCYLFLQNMIHLLHELHIPHDDECDLLLGAAESMEQVHDP